MSIGLDLRDPTSPGGAQAFARDGYAVLPALIAPALADFLWSYVQTKFACRLLGPGDRLVPNTPAGYFDPAFDGLLEYLRPRLEQDTGLRLLPTYSCFRLYKHGDVLKRHRDRTACEISVTLNIGQVPVRALADLRRRERRRLSARVSPPVTPCSIAGATSSIGAKPYEGIRLVQAFLHYVDQYGPHVGPENRWRPVIDAARHRASDNRPVRTNGSRRTGEDIGDRARRKQTPRRTMMPPHIVLRDFLAADDGCRSARTCAGAEAAFVADGRVDGAACEINPSFRLSIGHARSRPLSRHPEGPHPWATAAAVYPTGHATARQPDTRNRAGGAWRRRLLQAPH